VRTSPQACNRMSGTASHERVRILASHWKETIASLLWNVLFAQRFRQGGNSVVSDVGDCWSHGVVLVRRRPIGDTEKVAVYWWKVVGGLCTRGEGHFQPVSIVSIRRAGQHAKRLRTSPEPVLRHSRNKRGSGVQPITAVATSSLKLTIDA